jgi:RNA polymerase sigma-70 factor (ECF subfamily)
MTRNASGAPLSDPGERVESSIVAERHLPLAGTAGRESRAAASGLAGARREAFIDPRVRAAASGDRAAAHALLLGLLPRVRNLVRYLVRGDGEADDLAQEALIAIVRGLGTFRGEASLESWADRVAVRSTFAALRRQRRESAERRNAQADLQLAGPEATRPDEYADRRRAVAMLDVLPIEQRYALVMHHVLGMSVPEIARELGVPVETVRSRLRLARTRLRELGMDVTANGEEDDDTE